MPLIVATLLLTGISSYFAATSGISRIAKDFLGFKAQELQKQAESQWGLLVANNLTERAGDGGRHAGGGGGVRAHRSSAAPPS